MSNRLINALASGSLIACLGIAALMVRATFASDAWDRLSLDRERRVARHPEVLQVTSGVVAYSVQRRTFDAQVLQTRYSGQEAVYGIWDGRWRYSRDEPRRDWRTMLFGFRVKHRRLAPPRPGEAVTATVVALPLWAPLLITAVLPARQLMRWQRRRIRVKLGQCLGCGYDLRASIDRCPECGTIRDMKPATAA